MRSISFICFYGKSAFSFENNCMGFFINVHIQQQGAFLRSRILFSNFCDSRVTLESLALPQNFALRGNEIFAFALSALCVTRKANPIGTVLKLREEDQSILIYILRVVFIQIFKSLQQSYATLSWSAILQRWSNNFFTIWRWFPTLDSGCFHHIDVNQPVHKSQYRLEIYLQRNLRRGVLGVWSKHKSCHHWCMWTFKRFSSMSATCSIRTGTYETRSITTGGGRIILGVGESLRCTMTSKTVALLWSVVGIAKRGGLPYPEMSSET